MARSVHAVPHDAQHDDDDGIASGYAPDDQRPPLASYATMAGAFASGVTAFLVVRHQRGGDLPERLDAQDVVLVAGASFALSRLLTKKKVTAFVRAPFTEYQGKGDAPGELEEKPRGTGARWAIGELLTCPYCLDMWMATAGTLGLVVAPRETRLITSMLSAFGLSDLLQGVYRKVVAD